MLALVFLAGQLGGLAHETTFVHSYCAEHGERVHSDVHELAKHSAAAGELRAHRDQQRVSDRDDPSGDPEHEHCPLSIASREPAAVAHTPSVTAAAAPARVATWPAQAATDARIAGYRLAPKTSPPAA
ncbi:MAG: hypothetical protein Tsb0020_51500 [Haliangiales bacterium]